MAGNRISPRHISDQAVFAAYDDFLAARGARLPHELESIRESFDAERLAFFLREVCLTEVMDSSVEFDSTDALESERVEICQVLRRIDSAREARYSAEISDLQKQAAIRRAIQSADSSKIYIDTAGIKASFEETFQELFDQFRQIQALDEGERRIVPLKVSDLTGNQDEKDDRLVILIFDDEGMKLFGRLFEDVRTRFLSSNEHGLDSYLSVRIRHGTLAGQIRSPFQSHGLVTRFDSSTGNYEKNSQWENEFNPYNFHAIDAEFARLSSSVDGIIEDVKSNWVQIKSEELPDGYFDFDYTREDIARLWLAIGEVDDFDSFIDDIFSELWNRTELGLAKLRQALTTDLRDQLSAALDNFESAVSAIEPSARLSREIADCRTAVQNELNAIAEWFRRGGESSVQDFNPKFAAETVVEIVKSTFPSENITMNVEGTMGERVRGTAFPPFLDLLYILLENAVRHSRPNAVLAEVSVDQDGDTLRLEVSNSIPATTDEDGLGERIPQLVERAKSSDRGTAIREEGGTGFFKLGKILDHDLECRDWEIDVSVEEDRRFRVILLIDAGELRV